MALLNFMAMDRVDLSYASKEVAKHMSAPAACDVGPLKRIGRYLKLYPRCVSRYDWQLPVTTVEVFTDSDWGGDTRSRRSTSGGCIMRGGHVVSHWATTQQVVALSSAEAELNGICKAAQEGLAARQLSEELLVPEGLEVKTDASAAFGIVQRKGAGRIKHLQVKQLWVQERFANKELDITKIPRSINWSDLMTHHWFEAPGEKLMSGMNVERRGPSG